MTPEINSYEGAGYVPGLPPGARKKTSAQSIRETHRKVTKAFQEIGFQALNAADYERTMMLPVGRGRLACDETGDFDPYAPRPGYNPKAHGNYPRHVHSTITDGEYKEVRDPVEHLAALNTHKWADQPLERRKRFTLTPDDQMQNLKAQIESERAARLYQEKEFEARMANTPLPVNLPASAEADILRLELQQERAERRALEDRVNTLLSRFEAAPVAAVAPVIEEETDEETEPEPDEEEVPATPVIKRKR